MPPMFLNRSWYAISLAASRLVLKYGFLEIAFSHVSPGVHVNCHEGFREIDIDISAGFEPYLSTQSLIQLNLDSKMVKNRLVSYVEFYTGLERRHEHIHKIENTFTILFGVPR